MKAAFIFLGLLVALSATFAKISGVQLRSVPQEKHVLENIIEDLINGGRELVAQYDPLYVDHKEVAFLGHHGEISNLSAMGFSNFSVSHIYLSGLITWNLEMVIEVPKIALSVEHWQVDSDFFYGDGRASANIEKFKVSIIASINPFLLLLNEFYVTPSIGRAQVSITGIYNNKHESQEVSNKIDHFLNDVLNNDTNLHDTISKSMHLVVQRGLDWILN